MIYPKNWRSFQHYTNRNPPWIKLHKTLLDDPDYQRLPVASRALAPMLWLLASENTEGAIQDSTSNLAFRLRMNEKDLVEALKPLIDGGFFSSDSTMLADCKQLAIPETETETETETKKEGETYPPPAPQGGKKRSSSGMKFPIPEEMKEALTLLCSHWPRKGHTRQGEIYDCRVWSDPQDLWDAMNKYFPNDDKKLMINCGLVYLEKINPVKGKPCEGARAMKNFYGPTEAYWKFEKEAVEERGNQ